jgi:hypothetical protein
VGYVTGVFEATSQLEKHDGSTLTLEIPMLDILETSTDIGEPGSSDVYAERIICHGGMRLTYRTPEGEVYTTTVAQPYGTHYDVQDPTNRTQTLYSGRPIGSFMRGPDELADRPPRVEDIPETLTIGSTLIAVHREDYTISTEHLSYHEHLTRLVLLEGSVGREALEDNSDEIIALINDNNPVDFMSDELVKLVAGLYILSELGDPSAAMNPGGIVVLTP